jgi:hypothetical protein
MNSNNIMTQKIIKKQEMALLKQNQKTKISQLNQSQKTKIAQLKQKQKQEMIHLKQKQKQEMTEIKKYNINELKNYTKGEPKKSIDENKNEIVKNEIVKNEIVKNEIVKNEIVKNEIVKNEIVKNEIAKNEIVKNEIVKNEIVNNEELQVVAKYHKDLIKNFKKCIEGYHSINSSCIKETSWEDINAIVFLSSGIDVSYKSNGSHSSGMDINSSIGRISNKSAKYCNGRKSFESSSYRLTTVCSGKKYGTPTEIIEEINKRKNFDYYSFIVRDENTDNEITYHWILLPSNYTVLNPSSYTWEPSIGKQGKNKDLQMGWNTNEINGCKMSIIFNMSSQLWIHIEMSEEIKKYIIASAVANKNPKFNYINLLDNLIS